VRDGSERIVVNTILGRDDSPSYIFEAEEGYTLNSEAQAKLTPVE